MTKYTYKGTKKITINWNQYHNGDIVELESLKGLNPNLFEKVEQENKGGKKK